MKKILAKISLFSAVVLLLTACSAKTTTTSPSGAENKELKIGVVIGEGGAKDKSFNQANIEGVQAWSKENGATAHNPVENKNVSEVASNLQNVSNLSDVVSVAGYDFEQDLPVVAKKFPNVKYIYIDGEVKGENIASAVFKEQESGYLVGYAAALKSKSGKVGFLGGLKIPPVEKFGLGFVQGAKAANPNIEVIYQYSGTFGDINKGKTIAATMYDLGVDVIFTAAGNTGNGAIKEAQERAINDIKSVGEIKHWVVGVDKDQYEDGLFTAKDKEGKEIRKSVILTSAMKSVDVAVAKILDQVKEGSFKGNTTLIFGLKENGLKLPETNPNLDKETVEKINKIVEDIKTEKINVKDSVSKFTDKEKERISGEL
ncbi:MAG: BMP family ABC transporter substrate-binding protein [Gemella sp.]|nr:BMP family ABC transporter substrate-binding protein [Gemella sp.]